MSNSVISLGIQVDGENNFKSALSALNAQTKAFEQDLKALSASMGGLDKDYATASKAAQTYDQIIQANQQKLGILGQQLDAAQKKLQDLARAYEQAQQSGDPAAIERAANEYNKQVAVVAKLSAEMSKTEAATSQASNAFDHQQQVMEGLTTEISHTEDESKKAKEALAQMASSAITSGMEKLKSAAHSLAQGLQTVYNAANQLASKMSGIMKGIGAGGAAIFAGLGKVALDYNSQMESYTTNFATLLGSTEAAVKKVDELKKMAAATPFGMADLASATQTLLNFQVPAQKATTILQQLGDISLGNSEKLQSLATVFGQVSSAGKLTGQDLMQFINAGFNPLNEIAKKTGESMEQLRDRMSKGGISVQEVEQAFVSATSAGGQFFNGMQAASQTMTGLFSTLKDNVTSLIGSVFQPLTDSIKTTLLPTAIGYISDLTTAFQTNGLSGMMQAATTIIQGLLQTVQSGGPQVIQTVFSFLQEMIGQISAMAPQLVSTAATLITSFMQGLHNTIPQIMPVIQQIAPLIVQTIISWRMEMINMGLQVIVAIAKGIAENVDKIVDSIVQNVEAILKTITDNIEQFVEAGIKIIIALGEGLIKCIPKLVEALPTIISAIVNGLIEHLPEILNVGVRIVEGLWEGICSMADWLWSQITDWIGGIFDGICSFFGIKSPSRLMRDEVGVNLALGMAEGIAKGAGAVQSAYDRLMPSPSSLTASVDGYSVAARVAGETSAAGSPWQDNRPIVLTLNDRELGRAVRGYAQ